VSRDIGWIFLFGICFYEFYQQIKKFRKNGLRKEFRLVFAVCYLIFPILVPFGFIQAAKENDGVILFPKYAAATIRSKVSHIKANSQQIAEALDKYKTVQHSYPLPALNYTLPNILTTPIAYLEVKKFPVDILVPHHPPLGYTINSTGNQAVIMSRGTDWKWQVDFQHFPWSDWDTICYQIAYDPTNGTVSDGDIYRIIP
jgi:uncharacterized protein (UPF0333 family)